MNVLLNELSLHGQFDSLQAFKTAMNTIMLAKEKMKEFKRELYCDRNIIENCLVTHDLNLRQAIQQFEISKRRAVMSWLTKEGPFWEDSREHNEDEYLECQGEVITNCSLGEVAYQHFCGNAYQSFSFNPSNWLINPLSVSWYKDNCEIDKIEVINHSDIITLEQFLQQASPAIESWQQLAQEMPWLCRNLTFSENSFDPLYEYPFVHSAKKRIIELLITLDKFKTCFDEDGCRTSDGHHLYHKHFTGDKGWFSDSSLTEKHIFKNELTFKNPDGNGEVLSCTWHGKIKTPQFRIHFSWPITADSPLYVPYIGPKITKT